MKKRGALSWEMVAKWALFSFVLVVVVFGIIMPFFPQTNDFFKNLFDYFEEKEFTPYVAEDHLTTQEQTVEDSMNALVCAIQSTALGCKGWEEDCKPEFSGTHCDPQYQVITEEQVAQSIPANSVCCVFSSGHTGANPPSWTLEDECVGDLGWGASIVDNSECIGPDLSCDGIVYGTSCVTCEDTPQFNCKVKGFLLDQKKDELGFAGLRDWITGGMGDPKYVLHYQQFPPGEEAAWATDTYRILTKWNLVWGLVNVVPAVPGAVRAARGFVVTRKILKKTIGEVVDQTQEQIIRVNRGTGVRAARKEAKKVGKQLKKELKQELPPGPVRSFLRSLGKSKRANLDEESLIRKALVDSQIEGTLGVKGLDEVHRLGLIDEVLEGVGSTTTREDIYTQVWERFHSSRVVGGNRVSVSDDLRRVILPDDPDDMEPFIRNQVDEEMEFLRNKYRNVDPNDPAAMRAIDFEMAERRVLMDNHYHSYGLSDGPEQIADASVRNIDDLDTIYQDFPDSITATRNEIRAQADELASRRGAATDLDAELDNIANDIARENVFTSQFRKTIDSATDETFAATRLTKKNMRSVLAYRDLLSTLFRFEGGKYIVDADALSEIMGEAAKKAYPKSQVAQEAAMKQFTQLTPALFDSNGNFLTKLTLGNLDRATIAELEQEFFDKILEAVRRDGELKTMANGFLRNMFGTTWQDGVNVFDSAQRTARAAGIKFIPFSTSTARRIGLSGSFKSATVGGIVGFFVGGPQGAAIGAVGAITGTALAGGATVGTIKFTNNHKLFALFVVDRISKYREGLNEKYVPKGLNTLTVSTPTLVEEGEGVGYDLEPYMTDYFIGLNKENNILSAIRGGHDDIKRLFLVSPCKANLVVEKTNCRCEIETKSDVYTKEGGTTLQHPLEKSTATFTTVPEIVYWWDQPEFGKSNREYMARLCSTGVDFPINLNGYEQDTHDNCASNLFENPELLTKFLGAYHPIILRAAEFMRDNSLTDMETRQITPAMRNDPRVLDFEAVSGGLISNPGTNSIQDIVDGSNIADPDDGFDNLMIFINTRIFTDATTVILPENSPILTNPVTFERNQNKLGLTAKLLGEMLTNMYEVNQNYNAYYTGQPLTRPPFDHILGRDVDPQNPSQFGDTIIWDASKDYVFNYRKLTTFNSDLSRGVKHCKLYQSPVTTPGGIFAELSTSQLTAEVGPTSGPCILVGLEELDQGYMLERGANYCYSGGINAPRAALKFLIFSGSLVADAFFTGVSSTGAGAIIGLPGIVATSVVTDVLLNVAGAKWPVRN